jgi:hypothetical protein
VNALVLFAGDDSNEIRCLGPHLLFFTMAAFDFAGKFWMSGPKYNASGKPGHWRHGRLRTCSALGMVKPKMLGAQARAGKGGRYT